MLDVLEVGISRRFHTVCILSQPYFALKRSEIYEMTVGILSVMLSIDSPIYRSRIFSACTLLLNSCNGWHTRLM